MNLPTRLAEISARLEAADLPGKDTLCIKVAESSPEGVELARHAMRDLKFLTAALKEAMEALEQAKNVISVSVLTRGVHVKQLDGSVKYEMVLTMYGEANAKLNEALSAINDLAGAGG